MLSLLTAATKHQQTQGVHHHLLSCQTSPTRPPWMLQWDCFRCLQCIDGPKPLDQHRPAFAGGLVCGFAGLHHLCSIFLPPGSCSSWPFFILSVSKPPSAELSKMCAWPTSGTWSMRKPPTGAAPLKSNQRGKWSEWPFSGLSVSVHLLLLLLFERHVY